MPQPRKAEVVHQLHGTRPHYETAKGVTESHIPGGRPKCPRYLTPEAKKKFRSLVRELEARRTLTPGDGSLLVMAATLVKEQRKNIIRIERSELMLNIDLRQIFTDGVNLARLTKSEDGFIPEEAFAKAFEESKARFLGKRVKPSRLNSFH